MKDASPSWGAKQQTSSSSGGASWINQQVGVLKLCSLEVVAVAWWLRSFLDDEPTNSYEKMR